MSTKKIAIIALSVLLLVTLCFFNATKANPNQLKVRQETIRSEKISKELDGFIIVFFSDMNYGEFFDRKKLQRLSETINSFSADLIVFGGDLLDEIKTPMTKDERDQLQEGLQSLNARYGKFAVLGDEDMLSKEKVTNILEEAQFTVLNNETRTIGVSPSAIFNIIGLENCKNGSPDPGIISSAGNSVYSFLFTHCPDLFDEVKNYDVDYMCAGHSRNGQIYIPLINFLYRDAGCQKHYRGKYTRNNTTLDISSGVGQNRYNIRLNSDPEIVIYKLKSR
ncbi:MAG: metallophosphoesterase [Erysipelotrichaceae bacterium]|nr:metallophosphoesterase [Erysipelotrichaceae bacterium]